MHMVGRICSLTTDDDDNFVATSETLEFDVVIMENFQSSSPISLF